MTIRTDENNTDKFVVDTLSDLLGLLAQKGIQVKISDTSELRDLDIEESFEGEEKWKLIKYIQNGQATLK